MQGQIKFFNPGKGFGFITETDDGKDYFVHQDAVEGDTELFEGDYVEFEPTESDKGPRAEKVKKVPAPEIPEPKGYSEHAQNDLNDANVQLRGR